MFDQKEDETNCVTDVSTVSYPCFAVKKDSHARLILVLNRRLHQLHLYTCSLLSESRVWCISRSNIPAGDPLFALLSFDSSE